MKKKIAALLALSLFALPVLSDARNNNDNNPLDRLWSAVESLQSRLDSQDIEHAQDVEYLQQQVDGLTCKIDGGDSCTDEGGGSDGEGDDNGGGATDQTKRCGIGNCARAVPISEECVPGEPELEVCDGIDNDCDGMSDEDLGDVGGSCADGNGIMTCSAEGGIVCQLQ